MASNTGNLQPQGMKSQILLEGGDSFGPDPAVGRFPSPGVLGSWVRQGEGRGANEEKFSRLLLLGSSWDEGMEPLLSPEGDTGGMGQGQGKEILGRG